MESLIKDQDQMIILPALLDQVQLMAKLNVLTPDI